MDGVCYACGAAAPKERMDLVAEGLRCQDCTNASNYAETRARGEAHREDPAFAALTAVTLETTEHCAQCGEKLPFGPDIWSWAIGAVPPAIACHACGQEHETRLLRRWVFAWSMLGRWALLLVGLGFMAMMVAVVVLNIDHAPLVSVAFTVAELVFVVTFVSGPLAVWISDRS